MEQKKIARFPTGFFQQKRPTITASEALKNVIPFEWSKKSEKEENAKEKKTKRKTSQFD